MVPGPTHMTSGQTLTQSSLRLYFTAPHSPPQQPTPAGMPVSSLDLTESSMIQCPGSPGPFPEHSLSRPPPRCHTLSSPGSMQAGPAPQTSPALSSLRIQASRPSVKPLLFAPGHSLCHWLQDLWPHSICPLPSLHRLEASRECTQEALGIC